jgi:Uma2 family endonuclease
MKSAVRWTVDHYFRMSELGFFQDRRVELLNGEIIQVPAQATAHRAAITKISSLLLDAFGDSAWVVIQGTLKISKWSAPDPDFHILDAPIGTPDDQLPRPFLVIEVSDTTYRRDSGRKLRTYASAGIPEYWIVNLPRRQVEVYRNPRNVTGKWAGWQYATRTLLGPGERVSPTNRPDVEFPVDQMLP